MKIFLSPHNDDETLFGAFTILRHRPLVLVALDSYVQWERGTGITRDRRRKETEAAMQILGADVRFLGFSDAEPNWRGIEMMLGLFADVEQVWAPAIEEGGHEQHNALGRMADGLWPGKVTHYMTYTKAGKSDGTPVPFERHWPLLKLRALACYESQILEPSTRDHFLRPQYEYVQP